MRMEITGDGKRGKGSHVYLWKKCNRPCETNGWSSNSMNTLERKLLTESLQGTDYALQLYLHWSREKLVLNEDWEQIETNFSFIVSLPNIQNMRYLLHHMSDHSTQEKGPSHGEMYCKLPLCWVHQNNYEGLKKNNLYRISTVEKKPQRLYPVRFNLSWWAERNGIYNL